MKLKLFLAASLSCLLSANAYSVPAVGVGEDQSNSVSESRDLSRDKSKRQSKDRSKMLKSPAVQLILEANDSLFGNEQWAAIEKSKQKACDITYSVLSKNKIDKSDKKEIETLFTKTLSSELMQGWQAAIPSDHPLYFLIDQNFKGAAALCMFQEITVVVRSRKGWPPRYARNSYRYNDAKLQRLLGRSVAATEVYYRTALELDAKTKDAQVFKQDILKTEAGFALDFFEKYREIKDQKISFTRDFAGSSSPVEFKTDTDYFAAFSHVGLAGLTYKGKTLFGMGVLNGKTIDISYVEGDSTTKGITSKTSFAEQIANSARSQSSVGIQ
tara:strand:+ start:6936 stop:7919 length:984 start_codon:yes stop_codon:yes gene_type:complete